MAQVDFSNAVIEICTGVSRSLPVIRMANIGTYSYDRRLWDSNLNRISSNESITTPVENRYQKSLLYSGTFTTSGTEFYLFDTDSRNYSWKVSNISFNAGDTYYFQVDAVITSIEH